MTSAAIKSPQKASLAATGSTGANGDDSLEESAADVTCQCQFCGKYDPGFTDEKLDMHYWQACPMLMGCAECGQVIEISALPEHLLDECQVHAHLHD